MSDQRANPSCPTESAGPLGQTIVVENIIHAMSDGVMVISAKGEIVLVNQALCQILGISDVQMLGKGWGELFLEDHYNLDFSQSVIEVIQTKKAFYNRQVSYRSPQGKLRELIATTSFIQEDGSTRGVVAVLKDVTELTGLHRRERQLLARGRRLLAEKAESLDRIARAVAHEVRNPVTAIGGLANRLLKLLGEGGKEAGYLRRILEATARLEQIVAQVRSYAYLPHPNRQPTEVQLWVKELLTPYHQRAESQGVKLLLEIAEDVAGLEVPMDTHLMSTALGNLVDNGLEVMPRGGTLEVGLLREQDFLVIIVRDTGPGISPQDLPYLFDPFFTTKADRVGMSLAISKRIVSEHDGLLEVESNMERGTTFTISLPLAQLP